MSEASEVNNGLAIPLALVGNAINSIGYIIQKQAHMNNEIKLQKWMAEQDNDPEKAMKTTTDYPKVQCGCKKIPGNHFLISPYWWFGLILYGFGSAIHGVALSNGSHTIIAPMDAFTLVCNAIFAPLILKEVFSKPQLVGTGILVLGIAGIAVSAPKDPPAFESSKCFDMMAQTKCLVTILSWMGGTLFVYVARRSSSKDTSRASGVYEMLIICFIAAFFGSICQLSLKCFFSQLEFIPDVLIEVNFYMIALCFFTSCLLLEVWRQRALKNFDALFVVPIICAVLLSGSVVLGGICFKEFEVLTSSEGIILGVSVGLCMVGVMGISYQPSKQTAKFVERSTSMKVVSVEM